MPRTTSFNREAPFAKVSRTIRGYKDSIPALAQAMQVSLPTARKRLQHPEELTLADLKAISQRLHIPFDELRDSIQL